MSGFTDMMIDDGFSDQQDYMDHLESMAMEHYYSRIQSDFYEEYYDDNDYTAFNQIKGLIYGYLIGSIGTLGDEEQRLVSSLANLINTIEDIHTDICQRIYTGLIYTESMKDEDIGPFTVIRDGIALHSISWLLNLSKQQVKDCAKRYVDVFSQNSTVFDALLMCLEEVDNLNKVHCEEYEHLQNNLEKEQYELYEFETKHNITSKRKELQEIENQEKENGQWCKGKKREYLKKGTDEYNRKYELKQIIEEFEKSCDYVQNKEKTDWLEEQIKNHQWRFTSSINESFKRISEQIRDLEKKIINFFLLKNNEKDDFADILFKFDMDKITDCYANNKGYTDFAIQLPKLFESDFSEDEQNLLKVTLNAILSFPQERYGNDSIRTILNIIVQELPDCQEKTILWEYYKYRNAETDTFNFPENQVLASLLMFSTKLQRYEQIDNAENITHKELAFLFYGAYVGFANMSKIFNNGILFNYIDNYFV